MAPTLKQLEALAICVPATETAQFFFGDNIEGYFEGFANATTRGSGYWLGGHPLLRDIAARRGGHLFRREDAREARILPHLVRHQHRGVTDELAILHRRRAAAIRVTAKTPARLGAVGLFDSGAGDIALESCGGEFLARFAGHAFHMGVAASAAIRPVPTDPAENGRALAFDAQRPGCELVLYLAFDPSRRRALAKARALRDQNALLEHSREIADILSRSRVVTGDREMDRAIAWAKLTSYFLVTEEFGKGIWAGLPWFKNNWGRDTFIALPGTLLVTGLFPNARDVILGFLRYQDTRPDSPTYGRIPNRVSSATDIIYNTADGTPWLIRELYEYLQATGDLDLARQTYPQVRLALDSAIRRETDPEGFLCHDDADTWMDARIQGDRPWSPRGNRANDIQALWHNALLVGERLATLAGTPDDARRWRELADRLRAHFRQRFWNPRTRRLADRIDSAGRRDEKVRPNQLMVLSIPMIEPLLDDDLARRVVENAATELLFPYGIASLSPRDPWFHPYHHNDDWHHFDAAYHNGTVWGWNAGFTVTALCQRRQAELAAKLARHLARQILHLGCRGSMSELIEAIPRRRGKLVLSGTWAQAWSTAEFVRNAHQDFGGFHPRLLDGALVFRPRLPRGWHTFDARFPFGQDAALSVRFRRDGRKARFRFRMEGHPVPLDLRISIELSNRRYDFTAPIAPGRSHVLVIDGTQARFDRQGGVPGIRLPAVRPLSFAKPVLATTPPCLRTRNYLQRIREA